MQESPPDGASSRVPEAGASTPLDHLAPSLVLEVREGESERVEDLLAARFDLDPVPTCGIDLQGRISYVNPSLSRLIAFPPRALMGRLPPYPHIAAEDRAVATERHWEGVEGRAAAAGIEAIRLRFRTSRGETFPVLMTGGPIRLGGRAVGLIGFVHDLREAHADPGPAGERLLRRTRLYQEYSGTRGSPRLPEADLGLREARGCAICSIIGAGRVSAREHDVLAIFRDVTESSVIARRLGISEHTLRNHFKSIFRKLRVRSRLELYRLLAR